MNSAPSNPRCAADEIELIARSLRCFVRGLVGLLPLVGLPFAAAALAGYFRLRRHRGFDWNPAQDYLR